MLDINLFPVTVDLGRSIKIKGKKLLDPQQCYTFLSKIVTEPPQKYDLRVSIGEGDFLRAWLTRLCEACRGRIQINRLLIASLNEEVGSKLESSGLLRPGFMESMKSNMEALKNDAGIIGENINIDICCWPYLPPYHGWIYNDIALSARWSINDKGRLHVKTMMLKTERRDDTKTFQQIYEMFPTKGAHS
jgi:hypothetical protein